MLKIKNITKTYKTGDLIQKALNGVSLNLRDNEFVAILGPSGSGKTTLLNIIGGLDRYDSGDLIINNVSTKDYKDRDWDSYRNHTIGFVFQSYNLIPHQTVLRNVELALTIAGVSASERKQRALKALDEVGLKDQAHKKPNQMSGGQMQRVAIARALVNNPSILLADEPTGALDTATSIQVMELLKEVAKDRLVVMVTHNPDLANEYANRIVKLKDGEIIDDSNPYILEENDLEKPTKKNLGKARMSFLTALSLSFNNLLTKKGRTILTAFAGSIGIIGIALILSLSQGFQNYIDKIQEDTLSSYPLTITSETADATSAILSMVSDRRENVAEGEEVVERQYLTTMFSSIGTNDLKSFKKYLEENEDKYKNDVLQIRYTYSVSPIIYTIDASDKLAKLNPSSMLSTMYSSSSASLMSSFSAAGGGGIFSEMTDNIDSLKDQYDVLKGRWPSNYDEIIIVLSEPNSISDLLIYSLGLRDTSELKTIITDVMTGEELSVENTPLRFTYDDLLNIDLRLVKATDTYKYNVKYDIYEDMVGDDEYMRDVYNKSLKLKVVGIVCAKENNSSMALSAGVAYTKGLTQYVINEAEKTSIVSKQLNKPDIDVFSNKSFDEANKDDEKQLDFEDMITVDENMIKDAFKVNADFSSLSDTDGMQNKVIEKAKEVAKSLDDTTTSVYQELVKQFSNASKQIINPYPMATTFNVPKAEEDTACPLGFVDDKRLSGCILPEDTDPDYSDYTQVVGYSLNPLSPTMINVYKDQYDAYVNFGNMMTGMYKATAINIETLKVEELVTAASESFDGYVAQAKTLADTNITETIAVKASDLASINIDDVVANAFAKPNVQNAIQNLAVNSAGEYSYLLVAKGIGEALADVMAPLSSLSDGEFMSIDTDKFAQAFKFDMDQDELSRIMTTMMTRTQEKTYSNNVIGLGYQNIDDPSSMSFYFKDFTSKENFLNFLDTYNDSVDESREISYTDITGILMSSVKTIVDSVSYVLIAFVSISLIVSSIMIAVITLISVMERTKEIGILRAMGASKRNVSSIFNAETFIIGLLSGLIGVGFTFAAIPPINALIHNLTNNYDINAVLPTKYAIILVLISVVLTMIAGLIPSSKAAKQDPVTALRTE